MGGRRGFFSAWGCCAVCRRVVSVRAATPMEAVGSKPYIHKVAVGKGLPWCPGVAHPALHFTKSEDTGAIERIKLVCWRMLAILANREDREKRGRTPRCDL